ncbi:HGxxPAAW family protein [Streptomyces omiyaensis]|uniref:HGxxPAAW family protein n=1 Tax=Streptomyces omiyaensis TaxID=68247 RepID=UPI0036FA6C31
MSVHGDVDLGHTVAGWTGTALAALGCTALGAAVCLVSAPLAGLGAALLAAAALATWLLHLAGWGKPSGPRPAAARAWRVRDAAAAAGHPDCLGCRLAGRGTPAAPPSPARTADGAPKGPVPARA